jgi:hypothetical protein
VQVARERHVELDDVRVEPQGVLEARVSGARVVDRQAQAGSPGGLQAGRQVVVVVDRRVLGHLEDDASVGPRWQHVTEPGGGGGRGRDVHRQELVIRQVVEDLDGRPDRGDLELDAQADLPCVREPDVRRAVGLEREPCQRLDTLSRATRQVEDGLVVDRQGAGAQRLLDACPLVLAGDPSALVGLDLVVELADDLTRRALGDGGGPVGRARDGLDDVRGAAALRDVRGGTGSHHPHDRLASSWADSATMRVPGEQVAISRAACAPWPGMRTSSRATSGWSSAASSMASSASRADPHQLDAGLLVEQLREGQSHLRRIVGDQQPDRCHPHALLAVPLPPQRSTIVAKSSCVATSCEHARARTA